MQHRKSSTHSPTSSRVSTIVTRSMAKRSELIPEMAHTEETKLLTGPTEEPNAELAAEDTREIDNSDSDGVTSANKLEKMREPYDVSKDLEFLQKQTKRSAVDNLPKLAYEQIENLEEFTPYCEQTENVVPVLTAGQGHAETHKDKDLDDYVLNRDKGKTPKKKRKIQSSPKVKGSGKLRKPRKEATAVKKTKKRLARSSLEDAEPHVEEDNLVEHSDNEESAEGADEVTWTRPKELLTDSAVASRIVRKGLLGLLNVVDPDVMQSVGSRRIITTATNAMLTPFEQLLIFVAGRYYSTLPTIGYNVRCHQLFHAICSSLAPGREPPKVLYSGVTTAYRFVTELRLTTLFRCIGTMLLNSAAIDSDNYLEYMGAPECQTVMSELDQLLPAYSAVYNMCFQLIEGGLNCIDPIPDLLTADPDLALYINSFATGDGMLMEDMVDHPARSMSLLTTSIPVSEDPVIPTQIQRRSSTARDQGAKPAASTGAPGFRGSKWAENNLAKQGSKDKSLMGQGRSAQTQVIRDTATFRQGTEKMSSIEVRLKKAEDKIDQLEKDKAAFAESLKTLEGKMKATADMASKLMKAHHSTESAIAVIVEKGDFQDLKERATINRTLVPPPTEIVEQQDIQSGDLVPADPETAVDLYKRINMYELSHGKNVLEKLVTDLYDFYISVGEVNAASNLKPQLFQAVGARKRAMARLLQFLPLSEKTELLRHEG